MSVEEIQTLKNEKNSLLARVKRYERLIGDHVTKLNLSPSLQEELKGLDALDALDMIVKRGGHFRSAVPDPPVQLTDEARAKIAAGPRSYM